MEKACQPACLKFQEIGFLRVGEASVQANGHLETRFAFNKKYWKCMDCGRVFRLNAAVDPNPVEVARAAKA